VSGGFLFEASIMARYKRFLIGAAYSSLSSLEGKVHFADPSGSLTDVFSASVFDLMPILGVRPYSSDVVTLDLFGGIGYGRASAEYEGDLRITARPTQNVSLRAPLAGSFLAGRVFAQLSFIIKRVRFEVVTGYRIADAGPIKGKPTVNGETFEGEFPLAIGSKEYGFDFSGVHFSGGVAIEF
jgi:hypothetical protein